MLRNILLGFPVKTNTILFAMNIIKNIIGGAVKDLLTLNFGISDPLDDDYDDDDENEIEINQHVGDNNTFSNTPQNNTSQREIKNSTVDVPDHSFQDVKAGIQNALGSAMDLHEQLISAKDKIKNPNGDLTAISLEIEQIALRTKVAWDSLIRLIDQLGDKKDNITATLNDASTSLDEIRSYATIQKNIATTHQAKAHDLKADLALNQQMQGLSLHPPSQYPVSSPSSQISHYPPSFQYSVPPQSSQISHYPPPSFQYSVPSQSLQIPQYPAQSSQISHYPPPSFQYSVPSQSSQISHFPPQSPKYYAPDQINSLKEYASMLPNFRLSESAGSNGEKTIPQLLKDFDTLWGVLQGGLGTISQRDTNDLQTLVRINVGAIEICTNIITNINKLHKSLRGNTQFNISLMVKLTQAVQENKLNMIRCLVSQTLSAYGQREDITTSERLTVIKQIRENAIAGVSICHNLNDQGGAKIELLNSAMLSIAEVGKNMPYDKAVESAKSNAIAELTKIIDGGM
ncbi:MAG: DUF3824 domain-containing protein [Puniceicoccales bacterium]|nr:DUF3824 domain-containing protein [Puniceicoccales bacterium]